MAAKFKRRKERKLEKTLDETAAAQEAQCMNEDGQERNLKLRPSLVQMLRLGIAKLADEIRQIQDILGTPHNTGKMVTTLHTHCEEIISPLSYPTLCAIESNVALEMADGLNEQAEDKLKQQLRQATHEGSIPTDIVDTGSSVSCVKPANKQLTTLECGRFQWKGPAFTETGTKSPKVFQMALGHVTNATDAVHLNLPPRKETTEAHTVPGIKHNLRSMNSLAKAGYEAQFNGNNVKFYNGHGDQQDITCQSVLEG